MSGADDAASRLETVDWEAARAATDQMNSLRATALSFAAQLADRDRTAEGVLSAEIDDLLESESPKFLLRVGHLPGSF